MLILFSLVFELFYFSLQVSLQKQISSVGNSVILSTWIIMRESGLSFVVRSNVSQKSFV